MSENVLVASGHVMNFPPLAGLGTGDWVPKGSPFAALQVVATGAGAITATVLLEASNDGINAVATPLATLSLTGNPTASDGIAPAPSAWKFVRMRVTAVTGAPTFTGTIGI